MRLLPKVFFAAVIVFVQLTAKVTAQVIFSEDFEGSVSGWTVSPAIDGWEFGTPTSGPSYVHEGTQCAGTVLDGYYTNSTTYMLTSGSITIPAQGNFELSFYEWLRTESGSDYAYLEIEENGSGSWTSLRSTTVSKTSWQLRTFDLNDYQGTTIRLRFRFTTNIRFTYQGWYIDDIKIAIVQILNLTVESDPNGTTSPSGTVSVRRDTPRSISASPSANYRFDKWTIQSGTPVFADSFAASTMVTTSTDAAIKATFKPCSVYTITQDLQQYNYTQHYYSGTPSSGVRFKFTPTAAGYYTVNLQNVNSHSNYLRYYGTSSAFSSYRESVSNSTNASIPFYSNANETHYFIVYTSYTSNYNQDFSINYGNALTLAINNDGNGTTTPSDTMAMVPDVGRSITAIPNLNFRFDKWTIQSGTPVFANSFATSTTVRTSTDAAIKATFKPCSVYTITPDLQQYNYTQHYYSESQLSGVRFKFTPTVAGSYVVNLQNINSHSNYLRYYDTSSAFSSYREYVSNSANASILFYSNANETHYFMVYTSFSSYYNHDFNINYDNALTLTVNNDGNGTTTPTGKTGILPNVAKSITATPSTGFSFKSWSSIAGNPVFADSLALTTTVTTSTDASIRANFEPWAVYAITTTPQQYIYNRTYYPSTNKEIRFKFTAPMTGTFGITLQNVSSHSNYIYNYGNDSSFSYTISTLPNSSSKTMTITATAGETHYFRVYPSSYMYYDSTFTISYDPPVIFTVSKTGSGWTSPSGTVGILSGGIAQNISAIPAGGYLFQKWTVVRGNPVITDSLSAKTTVTAMADSSEIRAIFIIDPNARPNANISDITISSHPDICLTASVTDTAGRSIVGLNTSNFILTQDSSTVPFQLTTVSDVAGVSVALVIDRSGSMDGSLINDAKLAAKQFVSSMNPQDRCAIVSFESTSRIDQAITSDTALLNRAIDNIIASGGTRIIRGAAMGIEQLLQETNARSVIVFSDGNNNSGDIQIATAIDSARNNNITIYSIGIGSSADRSVLESLADNTGGYYSESPDAAGLSALYAQIKADVQAQYVLCYQSPDTIFNGNIHEVVLSVSLNNHISNDTVYWDENNLPPVITLTQETAAKIGVTQQPGQPLSISANVTDDGTIKGVRLFYRITSNSATTFTEVNMLPDTGNRYQFTIPDTQVVSPGIDFYILATDNFNLIGRSPNIFAPQNQPHVIPVGNVVSPISYAKIYLDDSLPLPDTTTFVAGKISGLRFYVFDKNGDQLKEETLEGSTKWEIIEKPDISIDDSTGKIVSMNRFSLDYLPMRAYRTIQIKATFGSFADSGLVSIVPGAPYRVVIESHADSSRSRSWLNVPSEIDTIKIPDNSTQATVYAILRDSLGNYVDSLRAGTWGSADTIATVSADSIACIGTIIKNLSVKEKGSCKIFVNSNSFTDSATVTLLPYHYIALKIVTPDWDSLSSLTMTTNDDTTLITIGLRSDDTTLWEKARADWSVSRLISIFPAPPKDADSYSFSPVRPQNGYIIAHIAGDENLCDTVSVNFTCGKPVRSEIVITTPHEQLIAGDSISAIVKIYNKDGLVPGSYCFDKTSDNQIKYGDIIGYGQSGYLPVVVSGEGNATVNFMPSFNESLNQCFNDGVDTIKFVLYNAPASKDSLHRIAVEFDSVLSFSNTFRLKPAALHHLKLAHTLSCCEDSITLRHLSEQVLIYSVGYDLYENMRGSELCNWTGNGTLHPLHDTANISRVLYESDPDIVADDESGYIIARSSQSPAITDSLYVFVLGPRSNVISAVTADENGNGLLDKITITFDRPVYLESSLMLSNFVISYRSTNFSADSLLLSSDNKTMILYLQEQSTAMMQTAWTPQITLDNLNNSLAKAPDTLSVITTDGAGPVIESVEREIKDNNNRQNDLVTVTFSEKILGSDGNVVSLIQMPAAVFNTWRQVLADSMEQKPLLSGINGFNGPLSPNQLFFNMTNQVELTSKHYFNIRTDSSAYILTDRYNNAPHKNNRKVKVKIIGNVVEKMDIFPNPGRATVRREPAGVFHIEHNPSALDWVKADNAGVVMQFLLKLPENVKSTVKGQITILDVVGNVVCADPGVHYRWKNLITDGPVLTQPVNKNMLPEGWENDGTVYHYYVYWNGYSKNKTRAAPGIYKVVLTVSVETEGVRAKPVIYTGILGIKP